MVLVCLGVVLVAACGRSGFDTTGPAGSCIATCGDEPCPAGLECGSDQRCHVAGTPICSEQPDAALPDDAGDDAPAPDAAPVPGNVVFVTSTTHLAASIGSLANADGICAVRAQAAQLPGMFVAWLSDSTNDAPTRIAAARGFRRVDGLALADLPGEVITALRRPIALDENGVPVGDVNVLTGTDGTGAENANCNGYSDPNGMITVGSPLGTRITFSGAGSAACSIPGHLYCFQIDRITAIPREPVSGRIAFLGGGWSPGGGLQGADDACGAEAISAGYTGTFRAFLAATTSAGSRFTAAGANWVRPDGVAVAASPAALLAGTWIAPINVRPTAITYLQSPVWFGAPGLADLGGTNDHCGSWMAMTGSGLVGNSSYIGPNAANNAGTSPVSPRQCTDNGVLYCLQE